MKLAVRDSNFIIIGISLEVFLYGHLAKLIGMPSYSRHVGQEAQAQLGLNASGMLFTQRASKSLRARTGEMRVNLSEFGWFPSITELNLPQREDADRQDGDNEI
ncbi:hypothetical protein BYT27DRAFT_7216795 [Phlegmacium glaucopus]|nr:hypothetical protein BYT27DRAFT_7216795 [Phlegmacium glaucopus]